MTHETPSQKWIFNVTDGAQKSHRYGSNRKQKVPYSVYNHDATTPLWPSEMHVKWEMNP